MMEKFSGTSIETEYAFEFRSALSALRDSSEGVRGLRLQALYPQADAKAPNILTTRKISSGSDAWAGIEGRIQSGGDFLLIRKDGVLELDGRVTMQSNVGPLIDLVYRGLIDLRKDGHRYHEDLTSDRHFAGAIEIRVHASFETASGPYFDNGEDTSWISKRYQRHMNNAEQFSRLARNLYVGAGHLQFDKGLPCEIAMTMFQIK